MSASASASGHGASLAADGSYLTYWDNNTTLPVNLDFDLGSSKAVQYIGINQREDSVSYTRSSTETSARIADFTVYESSDGVNWGSPVKTGTLPNHRGVVMLDLPAATTRHIRLEVDSTYAASTDTTRYKRLRVDEAWIGSAYATASSTPPARFRYEAEKASATSGSTVDTNHFGYSGAGFLNTPNATGAFAQFSVSSASARTATLTFHHANGTTTDRPMDVSVNGVVVSAGRSFAGTGSWDTWADVTISVPLNSGTNTVRVTATTSGGAPNLDYLDVS
jgi:alpha-L-fucosidase